jgi:hypothetical protein
VTLKVGDWLSRNHEIFLENYASGPGDQAKLLKTRRFRLFGARPISGLATEADCFQQTTHDKYSNRSALSTAGQEWDLLLLTLSLRPAD